MEMIATPRPPSCCDEGVKFDIMTGGLPLARMQELARDAKAAGMTPPAVIVVGAVVDLRETLSWFETKPLFGWRVLVPRTKEQAASLSTRLRSHGAVPEEVPTISVEPPRNPQQMDKAVRGLVEGRYEWIAFTSVNAVRAVREKFAEFGLDARAFAGLKIAAVGGVTAEALRTWGLEPDLVPSGEQSAQGLLEVLARGTQGCPSDELVPLAHVATYLWQEVVRITRVTWKVRLTGGVLAEPTP